MGMGSNSGYSSRSYSKASMAYDWRDREIKRLKDEIFALKSEKRRENIEKNTKLPKTDETKTETKEKIPE